MIDNRDSKKRYRADVLIEDQLAKYDDKINKEVAKAAKRFGEAFDEAQFRSTNARVLEHQAKRDALHERFAKALNDNNLEELRQIILDEEIVCPISGTKNWTEVRQFNLMFTTRNGFHFGRCDEGLPPSGNGSGYFCELSERAEDRTYEDSFRHRTNR